MTNEERQALIARYKQGFEEVRQSLDGMTYEEMKSHPLPGKWSACEIVQHLGDSEMTSAIRLRKLLTEDDPVIQGYDQDLYAARLGYNGRPLGPALRAFNAARETTAQILDSMTEEDWARAGTHTESGRYTAEDWLTIYAAHAHNHAAQIRRLREAMKS